MAHDNDEWISICSADSVPADGGACAFIDGKQIAIFNFERIGRWFATDNACPHWQENVLSRGLLATTGGEPKVACPLHKRTYSLETGICTSGDVEVVATYPIKVEAGTVYIGVKRRCQAA